MLNTLLESQWQLRLQLSRCDIEGVQVRTARFSNDGRLVGSGSDDRTVKVLHADRCRCCLWMLEYCVWMVVTLHADAAAIVVLGCCCSDVSDCDPLCVSDILFDITRSGMWIKSCACTLIPTTASNLHHAKPAT